MILVTGGTGLVGAQLLFDLISAGKKVRAMRRPSSNEAVLKLLFADQPHLINNIEWVEGDTTDVYTVLEAMQDVEEVYHCAAKISYHPSGRAQMMKINIEGTANMVNMALECNVKKFCHVSSVAALGRIDDHLTIDENTIWKTSRHNSNYAISKYGGELEVWRGMEEGLNAVIVNPTIIIGAGNWKTGSSAMFMQLWKGMKYYSEGMMGFVDVRDVTKCMIELTEKNCFGQLYIITSENLTYREVFSYITDSFHKPRPSIAVNKFLSELGWRAEALRSIIMRKKPFITKETARNSQMRWSYSNEKIKRTLGITFIPVQKSVEDCAKLFLRDFSLRHSSGF